MISSPATPLEFPSPLPESMLLVNGFDAVTESLPRSTWVAERIARVTDADGCRKGNHMGTTPLSHHPVAAGRRSITCYQSAHLCIEPVCIQLIACTANAPATNKHSNFFLCEFSANEKPRLPHAPLFSLFLHCGIGISSWCSA